MVLETVQSLSNYLGSTGLVAGNPFPGAEHLFLVKVKHGHFCWRFKNKFVFFDIGEIEEGGVGKAIKTLRKRLRLTDNIYEFLKPGGPSGETVGFVMMKLSPIYKVLVTEPPNDMSLVTLRNHCNNFMNSIGHIYKTFNDNVYGYRFLDLPGICDILLLFVTRFFTKMRDVLSAVGDSHGVMTNYNAIVNDTNITQKEFPLSAFRRSCSATVPTIIQKCDQMTSIVFSTCHSALFTIIDTCIKKLGQSDYLDFHTSVLLQKHQHVVPVNALPKTSPIKQRRPAIKKRKRETWRDKRPPPLITNLEVNMKHCVHADRPKIVRKSTRIAKLNPRRSIRLKKK